MIEISIKQFAFILLTAIFVSSVISTPIAMGQPMTFTYHTMWGSVGKDNGQFSGQNDVDFFNGKVYVADYENHRVQIFDLEGKFLTKFGESASPGGSMIDGQFDKPSAISIDNEGNIYVADQFNYRIQKFTIDGQFITKWGTEGEDDGQFLHPHVPAVDNNGKLFVTDRDLANVQVFTTEGQFLYKWGEEGEEPGQISKPESSIVDSKGNVYIADYGNDRIQKFSNDGKYIMEWGTKGEDDGQFRGPSGLPIDASDNIYVTDKNNHRVQIFTADGQFLTKFGLEGSGEGQLEGPEGVGVDKETGTVYVADTGNNRIVVFKPQ